VAPAGRHSAWLGTAATRTRPSVAPRAKAWTPNVRLSACAAGAVSFADSPVTTVPKPSRRTAGRPVSTRMGTRAPPTRADRRIRVPTRTR